MPLGLRKRVNMLERHLGILSKQADEPAFEAASALLAFRQRYRSRVRFSFSGRSIAPAVSAGRLKIAKCIEHVLLAHFKASCQLNRVVFRKQRGLDGCKHRKSIGQCARASFS